MRIAKLVVAASLMFSMEAAASEISGAWRPERYILADGSVFSVKGLIFFTERDWTVLFFVEDENGEARRGSAEGGTYTLSGEGLTFTHLYHLSAGEKLGNLESAPLRMSVKEMGDAAQEPCRVEIEGESMTIYFPSGNRMTFEKSSGF